MSAPPKYPFLRYALMLCGMKDDQIEQYEKDVENNPDRYMELLKELEDMVDGHNEKRPVSGL